MRLTTLSGVCPESDTSVRTTPPRAMPTHEAGVQETTDSETIPGPSDSPIKNRPQLVSQHAKQTALL